MNLRFITVVIVAVAVCAFLVVQATNESSATVYIPSQLLAEAKKGVALKRIRVGGKVAEMPIQYSVSPQFLLRFSIVDPGKPGASEHKDIAQLIPVEYAGIRPDMFTVGRDVIIDGEFEEGMLHASKLLTQCPSKYEPPSPEKVYEKKAP